MLSSYICKSRVFPRKNDPIVNILSLKLLVLSAILFSLAEKFIIHSYSESNNEFGMWKTCNCIVLEMKILNNKGWLPQRGAFPSRI
jgi:hypothetical protein